MIFNVVAVYESTGQGQLTAFELSIEVGQSVPLTLKITVLDDNKQPVDLTEKYVEFAYGNVHGRLGLARGHGNRIGLIDLTPTSLVRQEPGYYNWDLKLIDDDGSTILGYLVPISSLRVCKTVR